MLFESDSHVIIVGRSGSGKTHTVAKIIEMLINHRRRFILLDWSGEYNITGFLHFRPTFSYPLLRNSLAEVMSEMIRLQSQTAGTWTYDSVAKTIEESRSFKELLQKLRENSEFPIRDSGAKAAYIRLNMFRRHFTNNIPDEIPWHVDLSSLDITSRKMALTFYLVQLYNTIIRRQSHNYFLVIEEALNIPENLLKQLLTQLRGYNVRCILVTQEFRDWFLSYNVILHDLGGNNHHLIYKHGVPSQFHKLNVGEVLLFWVEKHKWKRLRVEMPRYVKVLPKYQQIQKETQEEEMQNTIEEETEKEDNSEGNLEEAREESEEVEDNRKILQKVEEQSNFNNEMKASSDPLLDRILEEHKILSSEVNNIKYTINTLEGAVAKLSEGMKNDDIDARLLGLGNDIATLNSRIRELSEKLDGLENYVTRTFSEIMERISDLEHKTEYIDENIKVTRDDLMKYTDDKIEKIRKELAEYINNEIKKKADTLFNTVTENGRNAVKIANHADEYVENERSLVADVSLRHTGKRDMLKFTVKTDKIIVKPADYLGKDFKPISNELYKHGYKLDKDKEHGWFWHKTIPLEVV